MIKIATKTDWLVILLVFNFVVVTLAGFYGAFINQNLYETEEVGNNALNVNFDVVTGFSEAPDWFNAIFGLQIIVGIYLLFATIFPGG